MLSFTKICAVDTCAPPKIPETLDIARPARRPRIASTTRSSIIVKPRRAERARERRPRAGMAIGRLFITGKFWREVRKCRDACAAGKLRPTQPPWSLRPRGELDV